MNCEWEKTGNKFQCKHCGKSYNKPIKRNCPTQNRSPLKPPPMTQRIMNMAEATVKHIANHRQHCTEEQKQERFKTCSENRCGLFLKKEDGGICTHQSCGCFIRSGGKFMDKLSWAISSCPLGLWGPITKKDEETPEKGV